MLKPPSGNCFERIRSAARLIRAAVAADSRRRSIGRMHPELQQDVIGFERGIGRQQRAPVAVGMLQRKKMVGRAAESSAARQ